MRHLAYVLGWSVALLVLLPLALAAAAWEAWRGERLGGETPHHHGHKTCRRYTLRMP